MRYLMEVLNAFLSICCFKHVYHYANHILDKSEKTKTKTKKKQNKTKTSTNLSPPPQKKKQKQKQKQKKTQTKTKEKNQKNDRKKPQSKRNKTNNQISGRQKGTTGGQMICFCRSLPLVLPQKGQTVVLLFAHRVYVIIVDLRDQWWSGSK